MSSLTFAPPPSTGQRERVDTHALKAQIGAALGSRGGRYWNSLVDFFAGRAAREEFESVARECLDPQGVHLHNSLILGLIHNASSDVPPPATPKRAHAARVSTALPSSTSDGGSSSDDEVAPRKRLRAMVSGLSKKERQRLQAASRPAARPATAGAVGWAGSGADMIEKKRKDEEKRRTKDDKKRIREVETHIGRKDWRAEAIQNEANVMASRERLALSTQHAVARALAAPLCSEAKELPDVDGLHDTMTLAAVEAGLPGGVAPQAAALLLSALQSHLQNVASGIISAVRSNRTEGIWTGGAAPPASTSAAIMAAAAAQAASAGRERKRSRSRSKSVSSATAMEADENEMPLDPSAHVHPTYPTHSGLLVPNRALRNMPSNLSNCTASSALRTASSCAAGDSSMVSFVSTAPTSHAGDHGHDADMSGDLSGDLSRDAEDGHDEDGDVSMDMQPAEKAALQKRFFKDAKAPESLRMKDVAFLFALAPGTAVEPLGQGTSERLLAPDWYDESDDMDADMSYGFIDDEEVVAREVKAAAFAKADPAPSPRGRYIVDESAAFGLFDRSRLVEAASSAVADSKRPTKGGLKVGGAGDAGPPPSSVPAKRKAEVLDGRKRAYIDPSFEVVDTAALLGPFAE